jgi:hypothetical protein
LTTTNKDFKVKHGLSVSGGATFGQAIAIGEPTASDHAATKSYVDSAYSTSSIEPVIVATTANINISTDTLVGDIIDGTTLEADVRILIKNQTIESENGIYVINSSGPATRALDYNTNAVVKTGDQIYVIFGTVNEQTYWSLSSHTIDVGVQPLIFNLLGPAKIGNGLFIQNNELEIDQNNVATIFLDESSVKNLNSDILKSNLTSFGNVESLNVLGVVDFESDLNVAGNLQVASNLEVTQTGNFLADLEVDGTLDVFGPRVSFVGDFDVAGNSVFSGSAEFEAGVLVPTPTMGNHAATKEYVDDATINQEQIEIKTIDDLSNYFNGYNSRFIPTYKGLPLTLQNEFNLLLTIDGIIQSVGSPDYVWQSVMPRVGFRIDYDGYIAFPEPIPVGSSFDARVLVGSATTTQTKVYPFKAMDIVLGGY